MLLLPLHKPLSRRTLPWLTLLLLSINLIVFCAWQAGDDERFAEAQRYYFQSGLADRELPLYRRYLRDSGQMAVLTAIGRGGPARIRLAGRAVNDVRFRHALESGRLFTDTVQWQQWQSLRRGYDRRLDEVFTLRQVLRRGEWSPRRMLGSAFVHSGVAHLAGNLLFLLALGLVLEGAIGAVGLLLVYLLGALGGSAASLLWGSSEVLGTLGASGAIAALMGAFCVVWGRRPVRFFYWFIVLFDYVRAPAIVLLPLWLGWELYRFFSDSGQGIAFEAHIGGLIVGALLGAVLVLTRRTRPDFMRDDAEPAAAADDRWRRAQVHIGRMQNAEAERLLVELVREQPARFELVQARYRVAVNAGHRAAQRERALELLDLSAADAAQARLQQMLLTDLDALPPLVTALALVRRWSELECNGAAEALLRRLDSAHVGDEATAQAWWSLALRYAERGDPGAHRRVLAGLIERHPTQPQAAKARFLLSQSAANTDAGP